MSERPKNWPRWSRPWGPTWAGWYHMPRELRREILANPDRALAVPLAAGYRMPLTIIERTIGDHTSIWIFG